MQRRNIMRMAAVMLVLGGSLLLDMGGLSAADKASVGKGGRDEESQGHDQDEVRRYGRRVLS